MKFAVYLRVSEDAIRFAESVFATIKDRSDHAFLLSDIDAASKNAGCSADNALGRIGNFGEPIRG